MCRLKTAFAALVLLVTAATTLVQCDSAAAADRVALVIGNGRYVNANVLPNPPNDARLIAQSLNAMGFTVSLGVDVNHNNMQALLRAFVNNAASAKVAILFYAGHGMQVAGHNYLIPVDAKLQTAADLQFDTIELDKILASLDDPARANIIILDACRDNPLARSFARGLGATRSASVGAGLAPFASIGTGTLIAFATAPDHVALDGQGADSPFSVSLARHLRTPGLEVRQLMTRVRADVAAETGNKQIPWDNSSLLGDVYLAGAGNAQTVAAVAEPIPPPAVTPATQPTRLEPAPSAFLFPDSNRRYLSRDELLPLSKAQLRLARNEIYARHGQYFHNQLLAQYFSRFAWYRPFTWNVTLNNVEEANVRLIQSLER